MILALTGGKIRSLIHLSRWIVNSHKGLCVVINRRAAGIAFLA